MLSCRPTDRAPAFHRHRACSCFTQQVVGTYFGAAAVAGMQQMGEAAFKRQLYVSMIAQLLYMKVTIEAYRSSNSWGTIFWQYHLFLSICHRATLRCIVSSTLL